MLDNQIKELKADLTAYASLVDQMIERSIDGTLQQDTNLLNHVIFVNELKANELEVFLDEKIIEVIAKYSPKAKALRTVSTIMKINNDLERMADHAVNIARCGIDISNYSPNNDYDTIIKMSVEARTMLKESMSAFIEQDLSLANHILENDKKVNNYKNDFRNIITQRMAMNPQNIPRAMYLLDISRNLERIADLSTNIAENVYFIVNGTSIKHNLLNI